MQAINTAVCHYLHEMNARDQAIRFLANGVFAYLINSSAGGAFRIMRLARWRLMLWALWKSDGEKVSLAHHGQKQVSGTMFSECNGYGRE